MRKIVLPNTERFAARDVLRPVVETASGQGIRIAEMRRRLRLSTALEAMVGNVLVLEDADYELLKQLYLAFDFAVCHADLDLIAQAIEGAESVVAQDVATLGPRAA